jgi:hypothetical protein
MSVVQSILVRAKLVVPLSFLSVREHSHCIADCLERLGSSRYFVFVRMQLQSQLFVSFFDVRVCGLLGDAQNLVVVFALLDALHSINLVACVIGRYFLGRTCDRDGI